MNDVLQVADSIAVLYLGQMAAQVDRTRRQPAAARRADHDRPARAASARQPATHRRAARAHDARRDDDAAEADDVPRAASAAVATTTPARGRRPATTSSSTCSASAAARWARCPPSPAWSCWSILFSLAAADLPRPLQLRQHAHRGLRPGLHRDGPGLRAAARRDRPVRRVRRRRVRRGHGPADGRLQHAVAGHASAPRWSPASSSACSSAGCAPRSASRRSWSRWRSSWPSRASRCYIVNNGPGQHGDVRITDNVRRWPSRTPRCPSGPAGCSAVVRRSSATRW